MNGLLKDSKKCSSCAACENVCPRNAISMHFDDCGFLRPVINESICIDCKLCEKACPWERIVQSPNSNFEVPITYAAFAKNKTIRRESSSGGIFSVLAESVLDQNGIVIGVSRLSSTEFGHITIHNKNELAALRGSKYVQSNPGLIYREVKKFLNENKKVLFSGTPCQVAALYSYLGERRYENLWTIDIVCHGTPSIKLFQKYIQEIESRTKGIVRESKFRDKAKGWKQYSMTNVIEYCNGTSFQESHTLQKDLFLRLFLSNICLNKSCYNCKYIGIPRLADISLGDFWGVQRFHPEMDDDKGTSVVLVNNQKGFDLFNTISEQIEVRKSELNKAVAYNPCIIKSYEERLSSENFFKSIANYPLKKLLRNITL